MQLHNKGEIYRIVTATKGAVTPMDWGNRVLLIKEPTAPMMAAQRYVADTGHNTLELMKALQQQFNKWGLAWDAAN